MLFATNVLHATRDMDVTIQNCKALLRKGGLLIANELTMKTDFLTLTFGLTDGWWLHDDSEIRIPGSPMLSRQAPKGSNPPESLQIFAECSCLPSWWSIDPPALPANNPRLSCPVPTMCITVSLRMCLADSCRFPQKASGAAEWAGACHGLK